MKIGFPHSDHHRLHSLRWTEYKNCFENVLHIRSQLKIHFTLKLVFKINKLPRRIWYIVTSNHFLDFWTFGLIVFLLVCDGSTELNHIMSLTIFDKKLHKCFPAMTAGHRQLFRKQSDFAVKTNSHFQLGSLMTRRLATVAYP